MDEQQTARVQENLERYFGFAMVEMIAYLLLGVLLGLLMPRIPVWGGLLAVIAFAFGLYWLDVVFVTLVFS